MLRRRRFGPLYGSIHEAVTGSNPYFDALRDRAENGLVPGDVLDFRMFLDVTDPGLPRTLLQFGVREKVSTEAFSRQLRILKQEVEGEITVLDIGSNVGYFVLVEATVLGDRANIHAIEPVPENLDLLRKNIELNDATDEVSVHQVAIGNRNGTVELNLAERSNRHSFHRTADHDGSIPVELVTPERFLADQGIPNHSVHVLRLDVDGYEVEIFEKMDGVLASTAPLLLFVELHPGLRDADELRPILDQLEENDFEIVSTTIDEYGDHFDRGWREKPVSYESFGEIAKHFEEADGQDKTLLLIARRISGGTS